MVQLFKTQIKSQSSLEEAFQIKERKNEKK